MKICRCGFANQDEAQVCLACGTLLDAEESANVSYEVAVLPGDPGTAVPSGASASLALASESKAASNRLPRVYLILENTARPTDDLIVIPVPGGILGRAGDFSPEVFSPRVSGVHALLDFSRGRWSIKHLGRNKSYLLRASEWIELPREQAVELLPGDRLRLADMLFVVSMLPYDPRVECTVNEDDLADMTDDGEQECDVDAGDQDNIEKPDQVGEQSTETWVITCPVCGTRYAVDSSDARMNECANCLDALDKRRIASVAPKREVL